MSIRVSLSYTYHNKKKASYLAVDLTPMKPPRPREPFYRQPVSPPPPSFPPFRFHYNRPIYRKFVRSCMTA